MLVQAATSSLSDRYGSIAAGGSAPISASASNRNSSKGRNNPPAGQPGSRGEGEESDNGNDDNDAEGGAGAGAGGVNAAADFDKMMRLEIIKVSQFCTC